MAVRLRLPAAAASPFAHLPARARLSLIGVGSAVVLGATIALLSLESANPRMSPQAAPALATPPIAAPASLIGEAEPPPTVETSTTSPIQAPVMNVSADGKLGLAVQFVPAQVQAGSPLVLRLTIQNRSDAPLGRVQIESSGPWEGYAVADVTPTGSFERVSDSRATIRSQVNLAANSTGVVSLLVFPSRPGDAQFSFDLQLPEAQ
jgi:hypothetical protein